MAIQFEHLLLVNTHRPQRVKMPRRGGQTLRWPSPAGVHILISSDDAALYGKGPGRHSQD